MRNVNGKKTHQLKNVGTATALTITLVTSNVSTLAYAIELDSDINEEVVKEYIEEVIEVEDNEEISDKEEVISKDKLGTEEISVENEDIQEQIFTKEMSKSITLEELEKDWEIKIYSSDPSIVFLEQYIGTNKDIVIPAEVGGKKVKLRGEKCFSDPNKKSIITSITFEESDNGEKVQTPVSLKGIFKDCIALTSIDLSGLETNNVTSMEMMFSGCTSLKSVNLGVLDTSNVNNMSNIFSGCNNLESIDLSGADLSSVENISNTFSECNNLESVDLSGADLSSVGNISNTFSGCNTLKSVDLSGLKISSKVTSISSMFSGLNNLESVKLNGLQIPNVTNMYNMFKDCTSLKSVDLSGVDTSKVTNMTGLFIGCSELTDIKFGGEFTTKSVSLMNNMFKDCASLENIDLSSFDTSNVENMSYMFSDSLLKKVDLSSFDISNVKNMKGMFRNTEYLKEIVLGSTFKTLSVTDMSFMFCNSGVNNLYLNEFDTSKVTDMTAMFASLDNITILDLSSFNLNNNVKTNHMFAKHISVASNSNDIIEHNLSDFEKELLVITKDRRLREYDYTADACLPVGPTLNANGGVFENGEKTCSLFNTNVLGSINEADIDKEIENSLLIVKNPTRYGYKFVSWEVEQTITRDKASILDKLNTTYYAKWEAIPVTLPDDVPVDTTDTPVTLPDDVPVDDKYQESNNDNNATEKPESGNSLNGSNSVSNDNPQTGDAGVLGGIGLGLTSILGIFINNRKKN
ncbi:BspA family leucine-rich repeat surface protein [Romboutsia sp. Marseille-P6047]|uniref:BspA family leucine-rich repeat surface protein n=1 Tax=Romboutsia sp. Marseille-P6047 TaxID=2161817 RepID=UPI000F06D2D4|nr:BspA family leucine-rich repeat surface protein [Romboutsia sp. Marseille-P6047]